MSFQNLKNKILNTLFSINFKITPYKMNWMMEYYLDLIHYSTIPPRHIVVGPSMYASLEKLTIKSTFRSPSENELEKKKSKTIGKRGLQVENIFIDELKKTLI